jgi:hypothetical protein
MLARVVSLFVFCPLPLNSVTNRSNNQTETDRNLQAFPLIFISRVKIENAVSVIYVLENKEEFNPEEYRLLGCYAETLL